MLKVFWKYNENNVKNPLNRLEIYLDFCALNRSRLRAGKGSMEDR